MKERGVGGATGWWWAGEAWWSPNRLGNGGGTSDKGWRPRTKHRCHKAERPRKARRRDQPQTRRQTAVAACLTDWGPLPSETLPEEARAAEREALTENSFLRTPHVARRQRCGSPQQQRSIEVSSVPFPFKKQRTESVRLGSVVLLPSAVSSL